MICILLSAGLIAGGCSPSESDRQAVTDVLEIRSKALNTRDTTLYFSVISKDYNHKGTDISGLKDRVSGNFNAFESLSYQPDEKTITIRWKSAEADGTYRMRAVVRGKEITLDGTEHLKLKKEPGGWKIIAGL